MLLNHMPLVGRNNDYKPVFYKLAERQHREKLQTLLSQTPSLQIYDTIENQLTELTKINNVGKQLSAEDVKKYISEYTNGIDLEQFGVWVYYPWTQKLVHLLDEEDFIKVRTNRNLYKITPQEQETLRTKRIGLIGLSVGQSIALTIATERICGELLLADFDSIELGNMNRLSYSNVYNLGLPKVIATAQKIAELDPYIKVTCFTEGINVNNIDNFLGSNNSKLDILVEECDNITIKILSRIKAKEKQIPVVMDTNDRGMLDIERFDIEPHRSILHGRLPELDGMDASAVVQKLTTLTPEEKIKYVVQVIGMENVSEEMKHSLSEINKSITGWPQLSSAVTLGGAMVTDTCRRIALEKLTTSGRFFIHFTDLIK